MKIRNIEVDFDFLDADDVERFEKEAKKVKEECEIRSKKVKEECEIRSKKEMSNSEVIREECNIIENFFNNVFGENISEKLFNSKKNLNEHIKAFEDIVNEKITQQKGLQNTLNRYQPNREQRRNNQYHKGNKR